MTVVTNPARISSEDDGLPAADNAASNVEVAAAAAANGEVRLYDDERQSDIVFVAGVNGDTWRYPAHRRVLAATSPVFAALLAAKTDVIVVDYVDRRGFEQLLRFLYSEPNQLSSVATARSTLDAAYKFLCPALAEKCVRRLDEMLDVSVALEILRDLRFMCARLPGAASAPSLSALTDDTAARLLAQCSQWCDSLAHNALLLLDEHADEALGNELLDELTYEDLALIVKRESFRVSSELVLSEALGRWATAHCKRCKRELTPSNKRAALGELAYCPRYLLLRGEELEWVLAMELLEPSERVVVAARVRQLSTRGAPAVPVSPEQEVQLRRWLRPRPEHPAALPVPLSARSEPDPEPRSSLLCARRHKQPRRTSIASEDKKQGCCACFGDGLLRAFICLFD